MTRIRAALCAAVVAAFAVTASPASAAVVVGQTAPEGTAAGVYAFCIGTSEWRQKSIAAGGNYVVPHDGVLTSWSSRTGPYAYSHKLKVLRPAGSGFTVIGAADGSASGGLDALNTSPTRIPVDAGDELAVRSQAPTSSQGAACMWNTQLWTLDITQVAYPSDVPVGGTLVFPHDNAGSRLNASAVLEADADGDGYGDETQDECPKDPTTQDDAVCNEPPTVLISAADANGHEGDTLATSGEFGDPDGDHLSLSASGDGTFVDHGNGSWTWNLAATDDVAPSSITVTATDPDGETASDTFTYRALNKAPTVLAAAVDAHGYEGDTLTASGEFDDVAADNLTITGAGAGHVVDNGDGTWSWELDTTDDAGGSVTVTASDGEGGTVSDTFDYTALNKAPAVLVPPSDAHGFEGDTLESGGHFADAAGDSMTITATAGPGTFAANGNGTWAWQLATSDDVESGSVTVTAADEDGGSVSRTFGYSADNVDPSIGEFAFSGPACGPSLAFSVADSGAGDTHTGSVDWGDGSSADTFSGSLFSGTHDYSSLGAGSYTVTANVADDDGGTATRPATHTVHNQPSAILQPINGTGKSSFKLGSTIPVKITVADCAGNPVSTLAPQVSAVQIDDTPDGTVEEEPPPASPTSGTTMRWDETAQQYVYNLDTKPLHAGDLEVVVSDPSFAEPVTAQLSLRK